MADERALEAASLSLGRDVADRRRRRKGAFRALAGPDQGAVVDERGVAAEHRRPGPRDIRNQSDQPGLLRGSKVTPPIRFGVMTQTGREPAWLTTDLPCPRYEVSTKVETAEPSTPTVFGANDQALLWPSLSTTRQMMSAL